MKIEIKDKGLFPSWDSLDLFKVDSLQYTTQTVDDSAQENINTPFSIPTDIPYTATNKTIFNYTFEDSLLKGSSEGYNARVRNDNGDVIMEGIIIIESIVENIESPYYSITFKDKVSQFISELSEKSVRDVLVNSSIDNEFNFSTKTRDYNGTDVEFPYIDMCNDTKVGDELERGRQYISHGFKGESFGFLPSIKTKYLIEAMFDGENYDVVSSLFKINDADGGTTLKADDMYHIFGESPVGNDNSRTFNIRPNIDGVIYRNSNTYNVNYTHLSGTWTSFDGNGNYTKSYLHPPTNFDTDGVVDDSLFYSSTKGSSNVDGWNEKTVGYVASKCNFNAEALINSSSGQLTATGDFKIEIPMCYMDGDGMFGSDVDQEFPWFIKRIHPSTSSGYVSLNMVIYEDGYEAGRIGFNDENGDPLKWDISDATVTASTMPHYTDFPNQDPDLRTLKDASTFGNPSPSNLTAYTVMNFTSKDFFPSIEDVDFDVVAGRKYQCRIEPVFSDQLISATFSASTLLLVGQPSPTHYWYDESREQTATFKDMPKSKLYMLGNNADDLTVTVRSKYWDTVDEDGRLKTRWNIARFEDNINVVDSLENLEMTAWDLLRDVMQRFRCDMFWDISNQRFVFDTAMERRGYIMNLPNNDYSNISLSIDNSKPIEVDVNRNVPKNIEITNKDYGDWIDSELEEKFKPFGSYKGDAPTALTGGTGNIYTSGTLSYNFQTALINRTLCGDVSDETFDSEEFFDEYGTVRNEFAKIKDIGVRIAYLKESNSNFRIYKHDWYGTELNGRGGARYTGVVSRELPVITNKLGSDLLNVLPPAEGDILPSGFYSYMSAQENVMGAFLPKLKASIVLPDEIVSNNDHKYNYFGIQSSPNTRLGILNLDGELGSNNFQGDFTAVAYNKTTLFEPEVDATLQNEIDNDRDIPTIQLAVSINNVIKEMKSINGGQEWDDMKYFYLHCGETNNDLKVTNWKDFNKYKGTVNGIVEMNKWGIKNLSNDVANRNSPNGWVDTGFVPSLDTSGFGNHWENTSLGFGTGLSYRDNGTALGVWSDGAYTSVRLNREYSPTAWRQEVLINSSAYHFTTTGGNNPKTYGRNFAVAPNGLDIEVWAEGVFADKTVITAQSVNSVPTASVTLLGVNEARTGFTNQVISGFVGTLQYNYYGTFARNTNFNKLSYKALNKFVDSVGARKV